MRRARAVRGCRTRAITHNDAPVCGSYVLPDSRRVCGDPVRQWPLIIGLAIGPLSFGERAGTGP